MNPKAQAPPALGSYNQVEYLMFDKAPTGAQHDRNRSGTG